MNITRYTWPVIIAAGLHGALLLSFSDHVAVPHPPVVEKQKWDPPPKVPTEVSLTEPEPGEVGEKTAGVTPLPPSPEILRPLTDDSIFKIDVTDKPTPMDPVRNLRDHRGDWGEIGVGPHNLNVRAVPDVGKLDRVPRAVVQPSPDYPDSFRRDGINGSVTVKFVVDTNGRVTSADAVRWTHREFAEPAVRAVLRWRFEPGTLNGTKVRFRMAVPIEFTAAY